MSWKPEIVCSSHTISGVMPGSVAPSRHSFEARVAACAAAGYRGMCLHFRDYQAQREAGYDDRSLAAILHRYEMKTNSIEFLVDWFLDGEAGTHSRNEEATAYRAALAYRADTLNVGANLVGSSLSPGRMRSQFRELCERAGEHGLNIALEIVPWSDVPDIESAMAVIDGIQNAGLVVDSWHIFRGAVPLSEIERIPGDRILAVQVNDADAEIRGSLAQDTLNRRLCGEGTFDLPSFLESVARTGTTAPLSVEIISPTMAEMDVYAAARTSFDTASKLANRPIGGGSSEG